VNGKTTIVLIENSYLLRAGMEDLLKELPGVRLSEVFDGSENGFPKKSAHRNLILLLLILRLWQGHLILSCTL
jgi:hypothetical protein